jgi:hypothetical protein
LNLVLAIGNSCSFLFGQFHGVCVLLAEVVVYVGHAVRIFPDSVDQN